MFVTVNTGLQKQKNRYTQAPSKKYRRILKALHVNRNKGGEKNKETWKILQDKDPDHNKGQQSVLALAEQHYPT